ncbi:hypothetical protein IPG41_06450 [Candidatus Peregrinibacteria bacterium]|nr:MAG: hypothetical protein IPG41_06450 [Candidatus Peregrinibacteria bacterium]
MKKTADCRLILSLFAVSAAWAAEPIADYRARQAAERVSAAVELRVKECIELIKPNAFESFERCFPGSKLRYSTDAGDLSDIENWIVAFHSRGDTAGNMCHSWSHLIETEPSTALLCPEGVWLYPAKEGNFCTPVDEASYPDGTEFVFLYSKPLRWNKCGGGFGGEMQLTKIVTAIMKRL